MKINSRPGLFVGLVASLVGFVACSSEGSTSPASNPPITEVMTQTPTDPASISAPTSSASKEIPESGTPSTESVSIEIDADAGVSEVASVALGSPVVIQVFSETEQDFHLHGFDIDLMGDDVTFDFIADKLGDFELESHESGEILLTISVVED
ncbi:MAG: hypothetical protein RL688_1319 [Actinomycetota bacterium]|jgi:hypothetical protein